MNQNDAYIKTVEIIFNYITSLNQTKNEEKDPNRMRNISGCFDSINRMRNISGEFENHQVI